MTRNRVFGAGASALVAVLLVSGCGSTGHGAQTAGTSVPSQSSPTTAGPDSLAGNATTSQQGAAVDQSSQLAAIQSDVSQANSANSQVLTDLNAAAAAQAQNDSP